MRMTLLRSRMGMRMARSVVRGGGDARGLGCVVWGLGRRGFSVMSRRYARYGFIGLGQMGYNMAKNLQAKLDPTDTLCVYDINAASSRRFVEETRAAGSKGGAKVEIAESVKDAAEESETTITVLPEPSHVQSVFTEILTPTTTTTTSSSSSSTMTAPSNRLFIDCSTIDPSTSRAVAALVTSSRRGHFVDAPMSGGVVGASAGTLTFMLGAPPSLVPSISPILLKMGKRVLHCGDQGSGLSGKLANNYLLAINNIATAEAMNLGIKWGLEPTVLAGLINVSTGRCWPSEVNNPVKGVVAGAPASRDYQGGFGIALMRKDLTLAIKAAEEAGAMLELGDRAREVYEKASEREDCKGRDFSVVYRYLGGEEGKD